MKRYLVYGVVLFFLLGFSYADAALIGVGNYWVDSPRVHYNISGEINYDAIEQGGHFVLEGKDDTLKYPSPGPADPYSTRALTDYTSFTFETSFLIDIWLDSNGHLILEDDDSTSSVDETPWMREWVSEGMLTLPDKDGNDRSFSAAPSGEPTSSNTLVEGKVILYGYSQGSSDYTDFDFVIDKSTLSGKFIDSPASGGLGIWSTTHHTGITSHLNVGIGPGWWSSSWNTSEGETQTNVSGEKWPLPQAIPEPGTLLLLGSGLIGLASYARLKRKKS